jgi:hypothetical protein
LVNFVTRTYVDIGGGDDSGDDGDSKNCKSHRLGLEANFGVVSKADDGNGKCGMCKPLIRRHPEEPAVLR